MIDQSISDNHKDKTKDMNQSEKIKDSSNEKVLGDLQDDSQKLPQNQLLLNQPEHQAVYNTEDTFDENNLPEELSMNTIAVTSMLIMTLVIIVVGSRRQSTHISRQHRNSVELGMYTKFQSREMRLREVDNSSDVEAF